METKSSFWDRFVEYAPIIAMFLVWIANPAKAVNIPNPAIWLVGLTTLPALAVIIAAFVIVWKKQRRG